VKEHSSDERGLRVAAAQPTGIPAASRREAAFIDFSLRKLTRRRVSLSPMQTEVERKDMNSKLLRQVLAAGALFAGAAVAAGNPNPDARIAQTVQHDLLNYANFTVFDSLSFQVQNGRILLSGAVTEPFKKSDIDKIAGAVPGAAGVTDNIQVLPFSDNDNQLRRRVATFIYNDRAFSRFRMEANPPVHIIVDNGRVTLTGAVDSQADKADASLLASTAGSFGSLVNDLKVVNASNR
jgi:hyperosmotically inducible periplasmic protein